MLGVGLWNAGEAGLSCGDSSAHCIAWLVAAPDFRVDPGEAAQYLNACLEHDDPRVFLMALRDVAAALRQQVVIA